MDTPLTCGFAFQESAEAVDGGMDETGARQGVKQFFDDDQGPGRVRPGTVSRGDLLLVSANRAGARIAVYDGLIAAPRVEDVAADDLGDAIEQLASRTYNIARDRGGPIPYTIIREVSENLVHAGFREVVVTILDDGFTIRFADQGPGIPDKEKAFLPGFSTATGDMKRVIRGVGSGLPIVRETLSFTGGTVDVDDNISCGTVVTLRAPRPKDTEPAPEAPPPVPRLSDRQKHVLSIILESGAAGPSALSRELEVGVATAYRDLALLEEAGLIAADENGKRRLTEFGVSCLERVFE
jgi:anti-sigma regulatory factor (Ser/Thr protein kinase)